MTELVVDKIQTAWLTVISQETTFLANFRFKLKQSLRKVFSFFRDNLYIRQFPVITKYAIAKFSHKSTTHLHRVNPEIGEVRLKRLADVYHRSHKFLFLDLPHAAELPQTNKAIAWTTKRLCDWLAAFIILICLSPVMIVLAAIVASNSSGSVFFHQWRVGENGRLFRIIKFRTMISDADKLHHMVMNGQTGLHKCENDPRITPAGRWMRKYSLDELPQLFNVLRGEMSLVGPRPWALYDALRINGNAKRRLNSLPGVTGAWQVSSRSTMLDLDAVTECDLKYLRHWNLWNDLKILLMTFPKVLSGFGAC